jgi:UDP-N-acetylmuramyl pentapeptide synthase
MNTRSNRFTYSLSDNRADIRGKILGYRPDGTAQIEINGEYDFFLKIPGLAPVKNALAAVAVASYFGIDASNIQSALTDFEPVKQRFISYNKPCHIIDDTYNANPDSTIAALEAMGHMQVQGKRVFVMGDMLELGDFTEEGHRLVGIKAAELGIDLLYTQGSSSQFTSQAARQKGLKAAYHYTNKSELIATLKAVLSAEDSLLVKGSRGSCMEEIIAGIRN